MQKSVSARSAVAYALAARVRLPPPTGAHPAAEAATRGTYRRVEANCARLGDGSCVRLVEFALEEE